MLATLQRLIPLFLAIMVLIMMVQFGENYGPKTLAATLAALRFLRDYLAYLVAFATLCSLFALLGWLRARLAGHAFFEGVAHGHS